MKQHFGTFKSKVQTNSLAVDELSQCSHCPKNETHPTTLNERPPTTNNEKLEKQLAKLQAQMASLKASLSNTANESSTNSYRKSKSKNKTPANPNPTCVPESKPLRRPRPGYCFRCGEDGHIVLSCSNDSDPQLVETKRKEFKQKQQAYEEQCKRSLN